MKTVIYIGNFGVSYSTESHVSAALEQLGVRVIRMQESQLTADREWTEAAELGDAHRAAMILWTHTHNMGPEAAHGEQQLMIDRARGYGVPTVSFHLDRWWGLAREHQVAEEPYFRTDLVITADGGHDAEFERVGVHHLWMPPAVHDAECVWNMPGKLDRQRRSAFAFVGSYNYPHPEWQYREKLISFLRREFGGRFRCWPRGRAIRGQELNNLYTSVQVLVGDSCLVPDADGAPCTRYWSDRIPETIGRGGFIIHPWVEGMEEQGFVHGETIATYDLGDFEGLAQLMAFYAGSGYEQRERIEQAGRRLVQERHTYTVRMRDVLALVERGEHARRPEAKADDGLAAVDGVVDPPRASTAPKKAAAKKATKTVKKAAKK